MCRIAIIEEENVRPQAIIVIIIYLEVLINIPLGDYVCAVRREELRSDDDEPKMRWCLPLYVCCLFEFL